MAEGETKYVATGLFWRVVMISGGIVVAICAFYLEAISSAKQDREDLREASKALELKVERLEGRMLAMENGALRIDKLADTVNEINLTLAEERGRRNAQQPLSAPPLPRSR